MLLALSYPGDAQTYHPEKTAWQVAGYGLKPEFSRTSDVSHYGADRTGVRPADTAVASAIAALEGMPGTIYFPPGTYLFHAPINIDRDSIRLSGAGYDTTTLRFDLRGAPLNAINIRGTENADTALLIADALRGNLSATVAAGTSWHVGDWLRLGMDDRAYMTSAWAHGALAQTVNVRAIHGDTIVFSAPLRASFLKASAARLRRIMPRNNVGIECLKVQRLDASADQSSNIAFDQAVNCWVSGIESDTANFAHIEINRSSNIEVRGCYFHDAFAYGGGGQGYGVLLQFGSGECRIAANYFNHLRHSMVLQLGANGNVLAYNYSTNPFWTEPGLPDSSAGEIVLHGDYPFMNLIEGNIVGNIVIDDSHGKNGPLNTFFRNRVSGYGIFMNFSPATDSVQLIGNEITNNRIGTYFINGTGHFTWGNNYRGQLLNGTTGIPDNSLYLGSGEKPLCTGSWQLIGQSESYNSGSNYARDRVAAGQFASCDCPKELPESVPAIPAPAAVGVYPNPATEYFEIKTDDNYRAELYDGAGRLVLARNGNTTTRIPIRVLPAGLYILRIITGSQVIAHRILVTK